MAIRPLCITELTEVLALAFDRSKGATPKLNEEWQSEDRQRNLRSTCSYLFTIVDDGSSHVIRFLHFSAQEVLASHSLATSKERISHFHIMPDPPHATLSQACLGSLLQLGDMDDHNQVDGFPMAIYDSRHWVVHAQFGRVSHALKVGRGWRLFDSAKPYFTARLQLHDIEESWSWFRYYSSSERRASPLCYVSLCSIVVEYQRSGTTISARRSSGCGRSQQ